MRIVVVGDVVVDHHVYEGERTTPAATQSRGVQVVREIGGAYSLCRLLRAMAAAFRNRRQAEQVKYDAEYEAAVQDVQQKRTDRSPRHEVLPGDPNEHAEVEFGLALPDPNGHPCGHHALAVFRQFPRSAQHADPVAAKKKVWRADLLLGYGHDTTRPDDAPVSTDACGAFELSPETVSPADILILDDAGFAFRNSPECWHLPTDPAAGPQWIVLKMSRPVCRGGLWQALQPFRDRLIVVVSAAELRHEAAAISAALSWERTVEDLAAAIHSDPVLSQLRDCRHVIVNFSADGALWIDNCARPGVENSSSAKAELIYDAGSIEGQWSEQSQGEVFGYMSCMVAALTAELVRQQKHAAMSSAQESTGSGETHPPDFAPAISCGLAAMRDLRLLGHGDVSSARPDGYPVARLAEVLATKARDFSRCGVPWSQLMDGSRGSQPPWSIAVQSQLASAERLVPIPLSGLAFQVVQRGRRMLKHLPHATFGNLFSIDRAEIETLRTLRKLMQNYKRAGSAAGKPLSIGVFGPPGAGKSFGVKQIANEIFGKSAWLEFNLSQFGDSDLIGALHQVRDKVLEVGIPVVFWDEFDARQYHWLQYLLAPMQDGRFQEGQLSHPIGQCVFIFAGATSHTFHQFGPVRPNKDSTIEVKEAWSRYVLAKGPDFLSRLDGYYNVLGPNPRKVTDVSGEVMDDPADSAAPVRRALLLRQFLCGSQGHRLGIDSGLLRTLLDVPVYRNGARSLEKLALSLKPSEPTGAVRRSSLGSPEQLAMFVDFPSPADSTSDVPMQAEVLTPAEIYRRFMELCRADETFQKPQVTESLAASVHGYYNQLATQPGMTIQEINNRDYVRLPEDSKESNRAAARRISEVLAVAGLRLMAESDATSLPAGHDALIAAHIKLHIENMAELEHDLWCEERESQGWRYGRPRHDARKIHPLLIPYIDLPEKEKDKDRNQIRSYPEIVSGAGLRITFAGHQ